MPDLKYGPETLALIERTRRLTDGEVAALAASGDAAMALVIRDQLPPEHYRALTGLTIRARVIGRVHPDDPDRRGGT
jgi:hypothetical protein